MTDVVTRARADLEAGRAWKARDRLVGALAHRQDDELLNLLATAHSVMGNLPDAGALWFVTGRDDEMTRAALAAWRERFGNDVARLYSIPPPVRRRREHDLRMLQEREARCYRPDPDLPVFGASEVESLREALGCILFYLVLTLLGALVVTGTVTALRWAF